MNFLLTIVALLIVLGIVVFNIRIHPTTNGVVLVFLGGLACHKVVGKCLDLLVLLVGDNDRTERVDDLGSCGREQCFQVLLGGTIQQFCIIRLCKGTGEVVVRGSCCSLRFGGTAHSC